MSINGRWYDPITYQFSFSCFDSRKEQSRMPTIFQALLDEIKPYLFQEMSLGRRFHGIISDTIVPEIDGKEKLLLFEKTVSRKSQQIMAHCCLFSTGFMPRDSISTDQIDREWKKKVNTYMDLKQKTPVKPDQYKEWIRELMNKPSDKIEDTCFPRKCFVPHSTLFYLGYKMIRCQSREEYELFQEAGTLDSAHGSGRPACLLQTIRLSVPRSFFHDTGKSFPLQNTWVNRLKELCSAYDTSIGSIKSDILFDDKYENPLYTFHNSFKLGFCQRIGDIGWGMSLSKKQAELLGGADALRNCEEFYTIHPSTDGHVYIQLTPSILEIPAERIKKQWVLLSPYIKMVTHSPHSIGDIPVSIRLGIDSGNITMSDYGLYDLHPQ